MCHDLARPPLSLWPAGRGDGTCELDVYINLQGTNPNTVKVVLATNGDALHFSRAPIPYTRYGGNGGDVARDPKHVGQRSNAMVQNLTLREQEITKMPVIHLRHCERSAAIHDSALRAMDRHGLRPRDDEGILVISTSLTWLASQINGSQNNAK